jgi:glycerol 2-dehydrogenase (NADP+)
MLEYHKIEVGQGIKASGAKREDIFLTTKLDNPDHTKPEEALQESLKKLNTPYLDLCTWIYEIKIENHSDMVIGLMHWPAPMTKDGKSADKSHNWIDTWRCMEELYHNNPDKVKAIGKSPGRRNILIC